MRQFDYEQYLTARWDTEVVSYIGRLREYNARQTQYLKVSAQDLINLTEIAKIQSVDSSNAIEGISTTDDRLRRLISEKTTPRNRDESEILGYRDVLKTIHENYMHIPLRPTYILQLHRDLYRYSYSSTGGKYKAAPNYINARTSDGQSYTIFKPLEPYETPEALERICAEYTRMTDADALDALLLIPIFIGDFLCIHPFADGNGRMSRLLTTLMLYRSGFFIGKYISLEKIILETKADYYAALRDISRNWHSGQNDYGAFVKYFLQILMRAHKELDERIELLNASNSMRRK